MMLPSVYREVAALHARAAQQVDTVGDAVQVGIDHTSDAGLDDELGAVQAWRRGDIERCTLARVVRAGHFGYGVCLGMQHISFGHALLVLADVLKPRRSAVESVGYDGTVLDHQRAHLAAHAI